MEKLAKEKMESLAKYVPFIDLLLKIDEQKYVKFINIRKWIIDRRKYPLNDLNKIEQSIKTQYNNLLIESKVKIPADIMNIFAVRTKQFINLCSDEEDETEVEKNKDDVDDAKARRKASKEKRRKKSKKDRKSKPKKDDSDDDLVIINVDYESNPEEKSNSTNNIVKPDIFMDEESKNLFSKIDKFAEEDIKIKNFVHEPVNYTYQAKEFQEIDEIRDDSTTTILTTEKEKPMPQRRRTSDELFKRRTDFENDDIIEVDLLDQSVEVETIYSKEDDFERRQKIPQSNENIAPSVTSKNDLEGVKIVDKLLKSPIAKQIEIISLDSCSDTEFCSDDDRPSTSKEAAQRAALKNQKVTTKEKEKLSASDLESIDSVFSDMSEVMAELENNEDSIKPKSPTCNFNNTSENTSNKENDPKINQNISQEEIYKFLEDMSNNKDFNMDSFYAALSCVKQISISDTRSNENIEKICNLGTPPPANERKTNENNYLLETPPPNPPPIANFNTPPMAAAHTPCSILYPTNNSSNVCYPNPQQPQMNVPLTSYYPQNVNFVPNAGVAPPPRPKVNINDPRIVKQLQAIKNSPLFTYNVLNPETAASIMKICQTYQTIQPQPEKQQKSFQAIASNPNTNVAKTSSGLTYGEYKRRQLEKKLELERKREEERKASKEANERQELLRKQEEIRSKLFNTLNPCREQLTTLWSQQKNLKTNNITSNESFNKEQRIEKNISTFQNNDQNDEQERTCNGYSTNKDSTAKNKKDSSGLKKQSKKIDRVLNELKCTVKGFDQVQDYISKPVEISQTTESFTPRPIGLRRRSSLHALNAISEQLQQNSSDCSDYDLSQKNTRSSKSDNQKRRLTDSFRNSSSDEFSQKTLSSISKRRKTNDEVIKPTRRSNVILDDVSVSNREKDSSEDEERFEILKKKLKQNQPVVLLKRITPEYIRKHTKRRREESLQTPTSKKSLHNTNEASNQRTSNLKRFNNDCQMTERNTMLCVLCRSKPSDLTNHYVGRHKTESYVSRLSWSELDDLQINTPFAKLQPKTKNYRFDRYEVECPFCKDKLIEPFVNLYHHYAAHTGEYAFQCSHCSLAKPYRPDIQSHILHSKTCRQATVQVMYRYPLGVQCIYLHYCTICNFVQLNEANVLKHLREHHNPSKAVTGNVQKCILAAMSDAPDINETAKPPTPAPTPPSQQNETSNSNHEHSDKTTLGISSTNNLVNLPGEVNKENEMKFQVNDDDIPVNNEACLEDDEVEEQLKQIHEGAALISKPPQPPMTVIHCMLNNSNPTPTTSSKQKQASIAMIHQPIIKSETMFIEENVLQTPPRYSGFITKENTITAQRNQIITYEKYRSYPQNVSYLGLYKCMIDDCYYSTDISDEFCQHINDHASDDLKSIQFLQCPYCIIPIQKSMNPIQLIEHVRSEHEHLIYQCSSCCYRSCDASNVLIHQQNHHTTSLKTCKIYKCCDGDFKQHIKTTNEENLKNIFKILCAVCSADFNHTQLLIQHLQTAHMVDNANDLNIFSCIYCPLTVASKNLIRNHVALKHPGELPRIYDHNIPLNSINEDSLSTLNIVNLSESVTYEEMKSSISYNNTGKDNADDIKPDLEQLMQLNEETIKIRLQKLTTHTGVSPDTLYRCPETSCGGFFSIYELWLRHMKVRHHSLECLCPHCPTKKLLNLNEFASHFEEHRRHLFVCFHCPTTCPNEAMAHLHANNSHNDLGSMRFEQIRLSLSHSYSIMIQSTKFNERECFITEFLAVLDKRLKDLETIEIEKLKYNWLVKKENDLWLEDHLKLLDNPKVVRKCLVKDCTFITANDEKFFSHLRNHDIANGIQYKCKCSYSTNVWSFDEVINHIKMHSKSLIICAACSFSSFSTSKMFNHIGEHHSARDVPVVELFKINGQLFIKIQIIFADDRLTFSTMKNCFCCPEKNMESDVFNLHLKRYHKLTLNYNCTKCNFAFKTLKEVNAHFQQQHSADKLKIRCELSSHNDLRITSLNEFQVQIEAEVPTQPMSCVHIKNEPSDLANEDDDDVILLEENDVVIQDSLRDEKLQQPKEMPKLKFAPLNKLLQTEVSPQLKCVSLHTLVEPSTSLLFHPNNLPNGQVIQPTGISMSSKYQNPESLRRVVEPSPNNITMPSSIQQHISTINQVFHQSSLSSNTSNYTDTFSATREFSSNLVNHSYIPHHNNMTRQDGFQSQQTIDLSNSSQQQLQNDLYLNQVTHNSNKPNSRTLIILQNNG